jgi:UDP-N-acetylglucosamine acyltransferase
MEQIHPTALVSDKAKIGKQITIGPYAVIEDDVKIGEDCEIGPHSILYNGARVGNRVRIYQSVSVANIPQDLKYAGEPSLFIIGDNTVVREFATLHRGTVETGKSQVGKNCLLMTYSHIPHDCTVGDNCIIANAVQIGGHVKIGDWVIIGGSAAVHQFVIIGEHSMIAGHSRVTQDVPPYTLTAHEPLRYAGLNLVGLRRRGFKNEDIEILKETYSFLYDKSLNISQARSKIEEKFSENKYVKIVLNFLDKSTRGIVGK